MSYWKKNNPLFIDQETRGVRKVLKRGFLILKL